MDFAIFSLIYPVYSFPLFSNDFSISLDSNVEISPDENTGVVWTRVFTSEDSPNIEVRNEMTCLLLFYAYEICHFLIQFQICC